MVIRTDVIDLRNDTAYFAHKALSKSQIRNWDPYNPMAFWLQSVFNPSKAAEEFGDYLVMGKLYHMMLLQPELVDASFEVNDELGKSRVNKKWQIAQAAIGKLLVSTEELNKAKKMIIALSRHEILRKLVSGGVIERPFTWQDEAWGIPCKMRLDYLKNTTEGIYIIDYKTTAIMSTNTRTIDKGGFQYDIGFYSRGIKAKYGQPLKKFIFIFQSTKEDEENNIRIKVVEAGPQMEACEIATAQAVKQIVPRVKAWQKTEQELYALRIEKDEEKRKIEIPLKEDTMLRCWLPEIEAETWEVSSWFDRDIAEAIDKAE